MNEQLANAVFDILVAEGGADESLRANFVTWYLAGAMGGFRFGFGVFRHENRHWTVTPVRSRSYAAERQASYDRAHAHLSDLARSLRCMSPLQKLDWVHEQDRAHANRTAATP